MSIFSPHLSFRHSNLQSFLSSVTPTLLSRALLENGGDTIQYFTLGDLWDCYEEWSAYGVGVPIVLNNSVSVTQYYAPHLSAIQIFTNNPQQTLLRNESISIEGNSDGWDNPQLEANLHGHLYFKFYDTCSPYGRVPFGDKIAELAKEYPGLLTLKNVDLSPSSWMSIVWYPIYHIPTNGNCLDRISTSFLTYHTLSRSSPQEGGKIDKSGSAFYPFGLGTHKLDESIWMNNLYSFDDHERIVDLYNAAESWLKKLDFWHHDFINFFTSHFSMEGLSI